MSYGDWLKREASRNDIEFGELEKCVEIEPLSVWSGSIFGFACFGAIDAFNRAARQFDHVVELKETASIAFFGFGNMYRIRGVGIKKTGYNDK